MSSKAKTIDETPVPGELVFFHYMPAGGGEWINSPRRFLRVPCVGEYVAPRSWNGEHPESDDEAVSWCRVLLVVHYPVNDMYGAEVYAVEDSDAEIREVNAVRNAAMPAPTE